MKSTPPVLEAGGFHGQGSTCDPGDLLSALLPTLAGLLGRGQSEGVGESMGGPGADLHHHADGKTEGVIIGHSS